MRPRQAHLPPRSGRSFSMGSLAGSGSSIVRKSYGHVDPMVSPFGRAGSTGFSRERRRRRWRRSGLQRQLRPEDTHVHALTGRRPLLELLDLFQHELQRLAKVRLARSLTRGAARQRRDRRVEPAQHVASFDLPHRFQHLRRRRFVRFGRSARGRSAALESIRRRHACDHERSTAYFASMIDETLSPRRRVDPATLRAKADQIALKRDAKLRDLPNRFTARMSVTPAARTRSIGSPATAAAAPPAAPRCATTSFTCSAKRAWSRRRGDRSARPARRDARLEAAGMPALTGMVTTVNSRP